MKPQEPQQPLSTADIAKSSDPRGQGREEMVGQTDVLDKPATDREPRTSRPAGETPRDAVVAGESRPSAAAPTATLFPERDAPNLRRRWTDIQAAFVDEPRKAVQQADALVAEVMKHLAEVFANERATLMSRLRSSLALPGGLRRAR